MDPTGPSGQGTVRTLVGSGPQSGDAVERMRENLIKLQNWAYKGGVLIIGYDMLKRLVGDIPEKGGRQLKMAGGSSSSSSSSPSLSAKDKKEAKIREMHVEAWRYLINPGPDLVVCDEAHAIKNKDSKLFNLLTKMKSLRRIALTGSPLQNNLLEYWAMMHLQRRCAPRNGSRRARSPHHRRTAH